MLNLKPDLLLSILVRGFVVSPEQIRNMLCFFLGMTGENLNMRAKICCQVNCYNCADLVDVLYKKKHFRIEIIVRLDYFSIFLNHQSSITA